jgi:hypothetical protein
VAECSILPPVQVLRVEVAQLLLDLKESAAGERLAMNRAAKFGVPLVIFCVAGLYGLQTVSYELGIARYAAYTGLADDDRGITFCARFFFVNPLAVRGAKV